MKVFSTTTDNMGTRKQFFNSSNSSKDIPEFNIALLGALGVGKSALTVKYLTRRFIMEYDPTLEDTYTKTDYLEGQEVTVKIMDTCDKEDSSPDRYIKWAHGFIVVYSITSRPSFDAARGFVHTLSQFQRLNGNDMPIVLLGNKVDLERYRTVSKTAGQALATEYECSFHECSAAEDLESVQLVFTELVRDVARQREGQMPLPPLYISEDNRVAGLQQSGGTSVGGHQALGTRPSGATTRRSKAFRPADPKDRKDEKDSRGLPRRSATTFKIFNKGFKIFN